MRFYSSQAVETSLTAPISDTATSMTVTAITGYPTSVPFTVTLEQGTSNEEIVDVTEVSGTTWTITRGVDGSSGLAHSAGAKVVHSYTARDARESKTHQDADAGVHGLDPGDVFVGEQGTQTLANKTLSSPIVSTPTITGGTWSGGGVLSEATLEIPAIADYTQAQHDHSNTMGGGALPQTSVTGLDSRLDAIEALNTAQDATLTDHGTRLTAEEAATADLTPRVEALEAGVIPGSFKFTDFSPDRTVNSTTQSELTEHRQTFLWSGVTWPPNATTVLIHCMIHKTGATDSRFGAKHNGVALGYYGFRLVGVGSNFDATGELIQMVWDVDIADLGGASDVFSYWAWKDNSTDANYTLGSMRTWLTVV